MTSIKWGAVAAAAALVISVLLGIFSEVRVSYIFLRAFIFTAVFFGIGFGLHFLINSYFPELLYQDNASGGDLYGQSGDEEAGGARVNITMDNTGEYAVPELYKAPEDPNEMGNIEDLNSRDRRTRNSSGYRSAHGKGIDSNKEEGYNNISGDMGFSFGMSDLPTKFPAEESPFMDNDDQESSGYEAAEEKAAFTPSLGEDAGVGGLPDLDMMAKAFSPGFSAGPSASSAGGAPEASFVSMPDDEMEVPDSRPPRNNKGNKPEPMKGDFSPKELAEGIRSVLSKDK